MRVNKIEKEKARLNVCVCLGVMCTHGTCCCQWGENSKFNSFYYYGLIPEITNKERYAQQSHHTNDNEVS